MESEKPRHSFQMLVDGKKAGMKWTARQFLPLAFPTGLIPVFISPTPPHNRGALQLTRDPSQTLASVPLVCSFRVGQQNRR